MISTRKFIVMLPPFLIGVTMLVVLFTYQHNQNLNKQAHIDSSEFATTTIDVTVTEPLPPPSTDVSTTSLDEPMRNDYIACTMEAKQCPDGSFVGRTGPNCEFEECPSTAEQICSPESRLAEMCAEIYAPVCGAVQVECITTPCNPVPETFSNSCFACANHRVVSYTNGACTEN
jgi:hypothetical protein